jgi:hypothetical protein
MSIFGASANDIPFQEKANRNPDLTQPGAFRRLRHCSGNKQNGPPQARGACLEEIQTFLNRLRLRNREAANPTMPSPQTSRIWLKVDISGTGTGRTPTLSTLVPDVLSVPSAAKYPGWSWPNVETAENVPSGAGLIMGVAPV